MGVVTAIDFEAEVRKLFDLFDKQEIGALKEMFSDDAQGVDEISRAWMRGREAMNAYFDQLQNMGVSDIHSDLTDLVVRHWDDVAVVTCHARQTYSVGGNAVAIEAPGTMIFRRGEGAWKLELVHVVPLPDAA